MKKTELRLRLFFWPPPASSPKPSFWHKLSSQRLGPIMKLRPLAVLLLLPLGAAADTLYKCTDEGGVVLYTNQKSAAKNCTVLSREQPISTFSAPKTKPSDFPRVNPGEQKARDNDRRAILD